MFAAVKIKRKHVDVDQYKYSGHNIGFDKKGSYSIGNEIGRNAIIFGVDMSSSTKIDNRKKDILILGKGPTQDQNIRLAQKKCIQLILLKKIQSFA